VSDLEVRIRHGGGSGPELSGLIGPALLAGAVIGIAMAAAAVIEADFWQIAAVFTVVLAILAAAAVVIVRHVLRSRAEAVRDYEQRRAAWQLGEDRKREARTLAAAQARAALPAAQPVQVNIVIDPALIDGLRPRPQVIQAVPLKDEDA
jgi:hypothetical protein